jgi:hypothetical protein
MSLWLLMLSTSQSVMLTWRPRCARWRRRTPSSSLPSSAEVGTLRSQPAPALCATLAAALMLLCCALFACCCHHCTTATDCTAHSLHSACLPASPAAGLQEDSFLGLLEAAGLAVQEVPASQLAPEYQTGSYRVLRACRIE